jgi:CTP:molybdopterin cytidylyltransferase MocA
MGRPDRRAAALAAGGSNAPPVPTPDDARPPTRIGGLVLAAGGGQRFGSPKQLALLDGRPLLEHALLAMAGAKRVRHAAVVLGFHADEILARVELHGAEPVICQDWEQGQAASLRAGLGALEGTSDAIVVTLGDQPGIDARAIDRVVDARDGRSAAVRAAYGGRPGHPVLIEHQLFAHVAGLRGDEGARQLLSAVAVALVDCDGLGYDADVDTVEQLRITAGG